MSGPRPLTELLGDHPLPAATGDKGDRGTLVLVAGTAECPGAAILAAEAALRSDSGRVQVLTDPTVAAQVAVAVPEVLAVAFDPDDPHRLEHAGAVCAGPGLDASAVDDVLRLLRKADASTPLLLDAGALPVAPELCAGHRLVLMPNVSEAQRLLGVDDEDPGSLAAALLERFGGAVAVRGATTVVAHASGAWVQEGVSGLGTPGSGDVLAGIAGALLGRGLEPVGALGWAVAVHARAGALLADGRSNPGYLARDVITSIPDAVAALGG
jgi:ADP-dependent NAD(P)H-hydrate dehydratase